MDVEPRMTTGHAGRGRSGGPRADQERTGPGGLWSDAPVGTRRLPDPVRASAVRAVLIVAVDLTVAVVAALGTFAGSWIAGPALLLAVLGTIVATWSVVDVWVTRQVWNQRAGVISSPSAAARARRRDLRRARKAARAAAREQRRSGRAQLISRA